MQDDTTRPLQPAKPEASSPDRDLFIQTKNDMGKIIATSHYELIQQEDVEWISNYIGEQAASILFEGNICYKRESDWLTPGIIFVVKIGDRCVQLNFTHENDGNGKILDINFIFWIDFIDGSNNHGSDRPSDETFTFFAKMNLFLSEIDVSCMVELSGSNDRRDRLWAKYIESLQRHGKTNVRLKEVLRIDI